MTVEGDILVLDHAAAGGSLAGLLQEAGYRVRPFAAAQAAWDSAVACPPGLILLDADLAQTNGFDLHQRLQQDERTREIPVILLGTAGELDGQRRAVNGDWPGFIARPYREAEVLLLVDATLRLRRLQQELAQRTAQLEQALAERQEMEAELQSQANLFERLLDAIPDAIEVFDPHTLEYIRWNKACLRITGYTNEEYPTLNPLTTFFRPEDMDKVAAAVEQVIREGYSFVTADVVIKDGSLVPTEFTAALVNDAEGVPTHLISVGRDIRERLRYEEQREQIATIAERERLARRLHDAVTQTLFSASVMAEATPRIMEKNPALAQSNLQQLAIMLRGALAEMRTMLIELRPAALAGKPLDELLHTLVEASRTRAACPIDLVAEGDLALPQEVTIVFYRLAQEALNNCLKHADASAIKLSARSSEGCVELSINDDGNGFTQHAVAPGHLGLDVMAERIAGIGGYLTIDSRPGQGTTVTANWTSAP